MAHVIGQCFKAPCTWHVRRQHGSHGWCLLAAVTQPSRQHAFGCVVSMGCAAADDPGQLLHAAWPAALQAGRILLLLFDKRIDMRGQSPSTSSHHTGHHGQHALRLCGCADVPQSHKLLMVMEYVEGGTVLFGSQVTERRPVVEAVACNYFRDVVQV